MGKLSITTWGPDVLLSRDVSAPLRAPTLNNKLNTNGGKHEYIDGDTYEETMAILS